MNEKPKKDSKMSIPEWFKLNYVLELGEKLNPLRESFRIALIYTVFGVLWIVLSDKILEFFVSDKDKLIEVSMFKGWFFVIITSCLIFTLIYFLLLKINKTELKLVQSYEDLTTVHEELATSDEELREQLFQIQEYQNKLHILAYFDPLTGLPGGLSLQEDAAKLINENHNEQVLVIYIDLDNFKMINDTKGHTFGDQILIKVCHKLMELKYNYNNINFYRIYGDEFIAIINNITDESEIPKWMNIISEFIRTTVKVGNSEIQISASMGVAIYPEHGKNIDELKRCADIAMYNSKNCGKNTYTIYTNELDKEFKERRDLEEQLETALDNNEFEIYYQPQVDLINYKVTGLEALIRWKNKKLGFVPPDKFISIAEENHLIVDIGEWVLKQACLFAKSLQEHGYLDLQISVNISLIQLLQENFVDRVQQILHSTGIDPSQIELEITESTLIKSFDLVVAKLNLLRGQGFKIALDDFGTGYSSLNYLKKLPITTLKIDKTFIDNILYEVKTEKLLNLILNIGKQLELCVIAEGVEVEEQLTFLLKGNCDKIQGYLFSKPLPKEEVKSLLGKGMEL